MNTLKIWLIISSIFFLNVAPRNENSKKPSFFSKVKNTICSDKAKCVLCGMGVLGVVGLGINYFIKEQKYFNSLTPTQRAEYLSGNNHTSKYIRFDSNIGPIYVENNLDNPIAPQRIYVKASNGTEHKMRRIPTHNQNGISCLTCNCECSAIQELKQVDIEGTFNFLRNQRNYEEAKRENERLERLAHQPVITRTVITEEIDEE